MEQYKLPDKFTPEQIKKFNKIIQENGLVDEHPDQFVIHCKDKKIFIIKKDGLDVKIGEKHYISVPIEKIIRATVKYPDLQTKEALDKIKEEEKESEKKI